MSLLCGCASTTKDSPSHTYKMSKLRPPSSASSGGSRFGFNHKTPKKSPLPTSKSMEMTTISSASSNRSQSSLAGGLTLDPLALMTNNDSDSLGGYVPRNGVERARPNSAIVTISHPPPAANNSNVTSFDDTNTNSYDKPRSGLRSFFRKFTAEKLAANKAASVNANSKNNSKNHKTVQSLQQPSSRTMESPVSRNDSTGSSNSVRSNISSKSSKSKLSFGGNSPLPTRSKLAAKKDVTSSAQKGMPQSKQSASHSTTTSQPGGPLARSAAKIGSPVMKYSDKGKASRLSHPSSHLTKRNVNSSKSPSPSPQLIDESKQLNSSNMNSDAVEDASNGIDLSASIESDCFAPVATADTDSENSLNAHTVTEKQTTPRASTVTSALPGLSNTERRKPTIEITPLTKQDNLTATTDKKQVQQSDEMQVINRKMSYSAPRTYTIDEDFLGAIISEVNSLRQTIVELEHHLIGKQEHEEKIKAELRAKTELISLMSKTLNQCTCQKVNGFGKAGEKDFLCPAGS